MINLPPIKEPLVDLKGRFAGLMRPTWYAILRAAASIRAGSYTPTVTALANSSGVSGRVSQYDDNGTHVTVFFSVGLTVTLAGTLTQVSVSLPIPSDFSLVSDANGSATVATAANDDSAIVYADVANNYVVVGCIPLGNGGAVIYGSFRYVKR